MIGNLKKNQ